MTYTINLSLIDAIKLDPIRDSLLMRFAKLNKAYHLDISNGLENFALPCLSYETKKINNQLSGLTNAFVPLTKKNIFVEFIAESPYILDPNFDRFGLHIMNWDFYIKKLNDPNLPVIGISTPYSDVYCLVLYYKDDLYNTISSYSMGGMIGLDEGGKINLRDYFWIRPPARHSKEVWNSHIKEFSWFAYLVFATFSRINTGQIRLNNYYKDRWRTLRIPNNQMNRWP